MKPFGSGERPEYGAPAEPETLDAPDRDAERRAGVYRAVRELPADRQRLVPGHAARPLRPQRSSGP